MGEYLVSFIVLSLIFGVLSYLSYSPEHVGLVKLASSVLLLYALLLPAISYLRSEPQFPELGELIGGTDSSSGEGAYTEVAEQAFASGIKQLVCSEFGIDGADASVTVYDFDFKSMSAGKIMIALSGKGVFADRRAIAAYVSGEGLGECEVNIIIG